MKTSVMNIGHAVYWQAVGQYKSLGDGSYWKGAARKSVLDFRATKAAQREAAAYRKAHPRRLRIRLGFFIPFR